MKILYFYPENPLSLSQGNNSRANALLHYFNERNIQVDFVSEKSKDFNQLQLIELEKTNLVRKTFFLEEKNKKSTYFDYFVKYKLPRKILKKISPFNALQKYGYIESFEKIVAASDYDHILISYTYWSFLIKNIKKNNLNIIIDTHDFMTSQYQEKGNIGKLFQEEINILNQFDTILAISVEEKYLFSQFLNKNVELISHPLDDKHKNYDIEKKYDLIYVASDNIHNVASCKWFFENVYPNLDSNIKICVIGKISRCVLKSNNIECFKFVENLDEYYQQSKISICPMLTGTGVKIKVLEALSFGLPIVCSERGIDGLTNKINNGCLVARNALEFSNKIKELLANEIFYKKNHSNANEYFKITHKKNIVYENLDKVFM